MAYTALPDRRIPYDNDGTVVGWYAHSNLYAGDCFTQGLAEPPLSSQRSRDRRTTT